MGIVFAHISPSSFGDVKIPRKKVKPEDIIEKRLLVNKFPGPKKVPLHVKLNSKVNSSWYNFKPKKSSLTSIIFR